MKLETFIHWLTRRLFVMLPMSDETEDITENHLQDYVSSMSIQVDGSMETFPELSSNMDYIMISNMLHYWEKHDIDPQVFKREIRNALNILNKIEEQQVMCDG